MKRAAPSAAILIESMRDVGYTLQTAIADIIDNSITAGAKKIELLADTDSEAPAVGILDDGHGMSPKELFEAMRLGTRNPIETRLHSDLGRFGLGMKTASFSQCRRLTVITRKNGETSGAIWDLDVVAREDEWLIETPAVAGAVRWANKLSETGTLVLWEKLDRLISSGSEDGRKNFVHQLAEADKHIQFVFHRFISGKLAGNRRVAILLNNRMLEAFDPFHLEHPATQIGPEETFSLHGEKVRIRPVTLPHHSKVSPTDWDKYAGPGGYMKNQGFYLYRNGRLIIHGTWFGLVRQSELAKLSRIMIDIPNSLDAEWKIDIRKASAQLPSAVREKLRAIIEPLMASSKRAYKQRGQRMTATNQLSIWTRTQRAGQISYGLDIEHPACVNFLEKLSPKAASEFRKIISLIAATLPYDALFADISATPEVVSGELMNEEAFGEAVRTIYLALKEAGGSPNDIVSSMQFAEPFRSNWHDALKIIETIEQNGGNKQCRA